MEDLLCPYCHDKQTAWEDYLPLVEYAYNSSKHAVTGFSPFQLIQGYTPPPPGLWALRKEEPQSVAAMTQHMVEELQAAKQCIRQVNERTTMRVNQHRKEVTFEVSDYIWL